MNPQSGERHEEFPTPAHGTRMPVPTPPNGRPTARAIAVFSCVIGLVAGAAVASAIWLLFGNDGGVGGSSTPVSAPARLDEFYRFGDVPKLGSGDNQQKVADRQARYDRENSARLSESRHGAGAVVQRYASEDLEESFSLEVVRSPSPFPVYVPFTDPKDLATEKPLEESLRFGDVSCAVRNNVGQDPVVMTCLRTDDDLTVAVTYVNGDLLEQPEEVARLVDAAWAQVG